MPPASEGNDVFVVFRQNVKLSVVPDFHANLSGLDLTSVPM